MFRALNSCQASGLTASANTAITALIPPRARAFSRVTHVMYRCGTTAHTITLLKSFLPTSGAVSTLTATVAASGTSATVNADPSVGSPAGALANGDWVAIQLDSGEYFISTISGLASLTFTVNALPSQASAGNKVYAFGVPADHASSQTTQAPNPIKGSSILCTASVMNDWSDFASGLIQSLAQEMPLIVHSNNATAAGTFELVSGDHTIN